MPVDRLVIDECAFVNPCLELQEPDSSARRLLFHLEKVESLHRELCRIKGGPSIRVVVILNSLMIVILTNNL